MTLDLLISELPNTTWFNHRMCHS